MDSVREEMICKKAWEEMEPIIKDLARYEALTLMSPYLQKKEDSDT